MSFDTKITMTWASEDHQHHASITDDRRILLATMKDAGQTDELFNTVSPLVTERFFIDAAAAEEYQTELTKICNNHDVPPPVFVIG